MQDSASVVSDALRHHRAAGGLTIDALARRSGVSVRTIVNIEQGRGNPRLEILAALAKALDVPVADLLAVPA